MTYPLIPLFDECVARGLNVKGLSGWRDWQPGYWFRREGEWGGDGWESNPPNCFINHHTATDAYTSNVKNSSGQTKANIWLGLARPGTQRMYSEPGSGTPEAHFACATAANYGNGACDRSVYEEYVWRDRVAPNRPSGGDDGYANKHGIGMEIIHPGTGGLCDPGVFELAAQINAAAMEVYGWPIARILDHRSSTSRKQDLNFQQQEGGYTINALRTRIAEITEGAPPEEDDMAGYWIRYEDDDDREAERFWVEDNQARLAVVLGGDPRDTNRRIIEDLGMALGTFDDRTLELLRSINILDHDETRVGPWQHRTLYERWVQAVDGS